MIDVAITDDHKVLAAGLKEIIDKSGIASVSAVANSCAQCLTMLKTAKPNVLLLDIGLPDGDGCQLCAQLHSLYPDLKILMLTTYSEFAVVQRALDAGATGYVLKNSTAEEIMEAICETAAGEQYLCREVKSQLTRTTENRITLTGRERELLKLIVEGCSNSEIADRMALAHQTVKGYRSNLVFKLGVHNTAQLVRFAIEQKLV